MDPNEIARLVQLMMQGKMEVPDQFQGANRVDPTGREHPNSPTAQDIAALRAHSSDGMIRGFGETFGPQFMDDNPAMDNAESSIGEVYKDAAPYMNPGPYMAKRGAVPLPRSRPTPGYEGYDLTAREGAYDTDEEDDKRTQTEGEIKSVQDQMDPVEQEIQKAVEAGDRDTLKAMLKDGFIDDGRYEELTEGMDPEEE